MQSADRASFVDFIHKICQLDKKKQLYTLIWQTYSQSIRVMLDNPYIFQPFWDYQNGKISATAWQEDFTKANKKALNALKTRCGNDFGGGFGRLTRLEVKLSTVPFIKVVLTTNS